MKLSPFHSSMQVLKSYSQQDGHYCYHMLLGFLDNWHHFRNFVASLAYCQQVYNM